MTRNQFNHRTCSGAGGHGSSAASLDWASAYLSHWIEECSMDDSPRPPHRHTFHGHGSHHSALHSSTRSEQKDAPSKMTEDHKDDIKHAHLFQCSDSSNNIIDSSEGRSSTRQHRSRLSSTGRSRTREDHCENFASAQSVKSIDSKQRNDEGTTGRKQFARRRSKSVDFSTSDHAEPHKAPERPRRRSTIDSSMGEPEDHQSRRVHFADGSDTTTQLQSILRNKQKVRPSRPDPPSKPNTKVIDLPWVDHLGKKGQYVGEVNELIHPHGYGSLIYSNGKTMKSFWKNGMPTRDDIHPKDDMHPSLVEKGSALSCGKTNNPIRSPSHHKELFEEIDHKTSSFPELPFQPKSKKMILPDFNLGDMGRPEDMITETNPSKALQNIYSLEIHAFAWVLRTSGLWTYSIIADFPVKSGKHASIRFVMDKEGSTKTLDVKNWTKSIRLVNMSNCNVTPCISKFENNRADESTTSLASDDAVLA